VQFIPDLQEVISFAECAGEGDEEKEGGAHLSAETVAAGATLDDVVRNLVDRLQEDSDFLKILVKVVQDKMETDKHPHLRNFYMIIPALTVRCGCSLYVFCFALYESSHTIDVRLSAQLCRQHPHGQGPNGKECEGDTCS